MTHCDAHPVATGLIQYGLFPATPTRTETAFSIELLDLYKAMFNKSFNAMEAMAGSLDAHYRKRGFKLTNNEVRSSLEGH